MATIKEIAKLCNVSVATVSNIINNKPNVSMATRQKVMKTMDELDYTPNYVAKNLKMQATRSIGVIAEDMTVFSIPDIIDGITQHCEEEDYQILLFNLRLFKKFQDSYFYTTDFYGKVHQEIRDLMAKQVEGIIYVTAHEREISCIPKNLSIPAVMAYGYSGDVKVPSVVMDDEEGSYQLTKYLIQQGHRKLGVITGKHDSIHLKARLDGYKRALKEAKIPYNQNLLAKGDWQRESGYDGTDILLKQGATVIFSMNDIMAGGVYDRLDELKMKVGKDISVAGFDGQELSEYYRPALTTVKLPLHEIGYRASEIMQGLLHKEKRDKQEGIHPIKCKLLIRDSVGKME
ncbi:MAG: LacI family transcriptional regulator [Lachnospiraceae bacterium]|nr:LacI family transcriptional regulator [Lachnospiraceae bacterium]